MLFTLDIKKHNSVESTSFLEIYMGNYINQLPLLSVNGLPLLSHTNIYWGFFVCSESIHHLAFCQFCHETVLPQLKSEKAIQTNFSKGTRWAYLIRNCCKYSKYNQQNKDMLIQNLFYCEVSARLSGSSNSFTTCGTLRVNLIPRKMSFFCNYIY